MVTPYIRENRTPSACVYHQLSLQVDPVHLRREKICGLLVGLFWRHVYPVKGYMSHTTTPAKHPACVYLMQYVASYTVAVIAWSVLFFFFKLGSVYQKHTLRSKNLEENVIVTTPFFRN